MSSLIKPQVYRPDIDGLRAFAVVSVVVFHAFPDMLMTSPVFLYQVKC